MSNNKLWLALLLLSAAAGAQIVNPGGATTWSAITAPTGNLALTVAANTSTFNTTTANATFFNWKNTTAAIVGTSQGSPLLNLCGRAFHASADVEDCMTLSELPGNGNDAAITFNVGHTGTSTGLVTTQFPGPVASGAAGGVGGTFSAPEGTAPTGVASSDLAYADSTAHRMKAINNNGTATTYALFTDNLSVFANTTSAQLAGVLTDETGTGLAVFGTNPVLTTPNIGTPSAGTLTNATGYLEQNITGASAAGTITEGAATASVTRAGIATANLTAPWVFLNTNSTNNNTSITMGVSSSGTSTGQTTLNVNGASTGGDLTDWGTGGAWTAGVLSGQTIVASVLTNGAFQSKGTTAGFLALTQGTTSSAVTPCNAANTHCIQAGTATTASVETDAPAQAQGIPTRTGVAATIQDGYSGDANHSATVTIGSGTSVGSTSLCSTAICLVGTYRVNVYVDITTACGTSGTYVINLIYTDDQGSKTVPVNLEGTGSVPATGVLTTTSTANFGYDAFILRSTGAASINYSTTATACGTAGPMVGKLYLSVEPLM